jgi:hypothetical protein
MKPAGLRFVETYYLSPNLPFNPLSYLVRFGREAVVYLRPLVAEARLNFEGKKVPDS